MKNILLIATGGTIASANSDHGLAPELTAKDLLASVPELEELCKTQYIQPINMDSTNIQPSHWVTIATVIQDNYHLYDGFVITHGTDTMAYSAAGLSYMIQNSTKPIVLTGAQIPIGQKNTDAARNLLDAFAYACDEQSHGVQIVFSGSVICGTRARKNYTKRFDAFTSVNFPEIARIQNGRILRFVEDKYEGNPEFYLHIQPNVGLLKFSPGMKTELMRSYFDLYDGIVIESFGVGGIPEYSDFFGEIQRAFSLGKTIVMTTQVPNEGSDISIYQVGNRLKHSSFVLEAYDMTVEAAFTKLMWILGTTSNQESIQSLFYRPIYHDILII